MRNLLFYNDLQRNTFRDTPISTPISFPYRTKSHKYPKKILHMILKIIHNKTYINAMQVDIYIRSVQFLHLDTNNTGAGSSKFF